MDSAGAALPRLAVLRKPGGDATSAQLVAACEHEGDALAQRTVMVVGSKEALGAAVVAALRGSAFDVVDVSAHQPVLDGVWAVVLLPPLIVCDHGEGKPRRFLTGLDPFTDPSSHGRPVDREQRLGTAQTRRLVETSAVPGTRLAMLSASLHLGPPLRGELDGQLAPGELVLHRQLTILEGPVAQSLPQLWSLDALPSVTREGWGLGALTAWAPAPDETRRRAQLEETAQRLVNDLLQVRRTRSGLQLGDVDF